MMLQLSDDKAESVQQSDDIIHPRTTVRYVRNDLKTYLTDYSLLNSGHLNTKLIDISSGGVQIVSSRNLRVNKKLTVNICFLDGYKFEIKGKIVRKKEQHFFLYDLQYDGLNPYINTQDSTFNKVYLVIGEERLKTKYRNITSNSVQILTYEELDKKQRILLVFEFRNGETIERDAAVSHFKKSLKYNYGVKFERKNQLLGNYLLKTQKSLVFAK